MSAVISVILMVALLVCGVTACQATFNHNRHVITHTR